MRRVMTTAMAAMAFGVLVAVPASAAQAKWVRGPVTTMTGETITVTVKGAEATFKVEPATQLIARGAGTASREAAALGKPGPAIRDFVKVGDHVEVHYREVGGAKVATLVRPIASDEEAVSEKTGNMSAFGAVVSLTDAELVVSTDGRDRKFTISSKTRVTGTGAGTKARELAAAGKPSPITEFVRPGDRVVVYYLTEGSAPEATGVRVVQKALK